jgi:hypothetical protein
MSLIVVIVVALAVADAVCLVVATAVYYMSEVVKVKCTRQAPDLPAHPSRYVGFRANGSHTFHYSASSPSPASSATSRQRELTPQQPPLFLLISFARTPRD